MTTQTPVAEPATRIDVADGAELFEDAPATGAARMPRMDEDAPEGKRSGSRDRQKKRNG